MLMSQPDDIAWTLNMRGREVHCCPVFVSYLLIGSHHTTLIVDERRLTAEIDNYLSTQNIAIKPYVLMLWMQTGWSRAGSGALTSGL
jgi:Xaa-Pro aminopeptidase